MMNLTGDTLTETIKNNPQPDKVEIDKDGHTSINLKIKKAKDMYQYLNIDIWDTYSNLLETKWSTLPQDKKDLIQTPETFLSNKNFVIGIMHTIYNSSLDHFEMQLKHMRKKCKKLEKQIKEWKRKQKDLKLLTLDDII